ncbi:tRNA preQ1(34) S-adenosylmethionine ribosyltransferase-isomerase QueA [Anaerolineales bacterium HSG6]|nr:tRNA preQ1(34) S-adenosylmethionine ribosyltransferase-isomerase QueA [Anaerolineales bacterium HSG6]
MQVSEFDYYLPPERIAQTPIEPRDSARLMVINRQNGDISHHHFTDIVNYFDSGDLLVANNSRVIPARLFGRKETGGKVEILLLKKKTATQWEALVGGKRLKPGVSVLFDQHASSSESTASSCSLLIIDDLGEAKRLVEFNQPIDDQLSSLGHVPLPPYIQHALLDEERYQTIFSRVEGSAAAPTAGLHFTPELLLTLRERGVGLDYVTLNIGLDTFKPVTAKKVDEHVIHREFTTLTADTAHNINRTKLASKRVIAVGTTSVRTIETSALRAAGHNDSLRQASHLPINQCGWQTVVAVAEETDLFIYPGYQFRAVDIMLTNFHLPKSSLLMLVSAFAGADLIKQAYQIAIEKAYRFYSFGDAMLIL